MLPHDIYWTIFNIIKCPKTFIKLSLSNRSLWQISQDERLRHRFIIRGTESIYNFTKYYINLLSGGALHGKCTKQEPNKYTSYSIEYKNGKIDGEYKEYYIGYLYKRVMYKNNILHGLYEIWYTGSEQISYRYEYQNGKINGLHESWYTDGTIHMRTMYTNGQKLLFE